MKLYRIETLGFGRYFEHDVNCPPEWIGSGVYDVEHEFHQEAWFEVAAPTLKDALALVGREFAKHSDYHTFDSVWYAPSTVEETDYEDEEREPPFFADWGYEEPVEGRDAPEKYDKEI